MPNPLNTDPELVPGITVSNIVWTAVNLDPQVIVVQLSRIGIQTPDSDPINIGNLLIKYVNMYGLSWLFNAVLFHAPPENPQAANYSDALQLKAHVLSLVQALQTGQTLATVPAVP